MNTSKRDGPWNPFEKKRLAEILHRIGYKTNDWKLIANYVGTRTPEQCRSHYQKEKAKQDYPQTPGKPRMYCIFRVHKSTQYEPQIKEYAQVSVRLEETPNNNFTRIEEELIDDFLCDNRNMETAESQARLRSVNWKNEECELSNIPDALDMIADGLPQITYIH